jgi:hypothetical protein
MMRQKIVTPYIFLMAFLILTGHSLFPQEKIEDSDIPDILLQEISLHLNNASFETVLESISAKSDVQLNYNRNRIPVEQVVSIHVENESVVDVLRQVLDMTNTELRISSGYQILIVPADLDKNIKGRIYGTVISSENKRPLIGANVLLDGFLLGAATDTSGKFTMDNLPVGNYTVKISYIGYKTIYVPDVIVKSERIRFLNAELEEASIPGQQVIIEDNYFTTVNAQPVSSTNYSAEEIRRAATISGDVTRIVNGLPSLSNENEGNHLIARGGSSIENSFYVDNILVPNIHHFPFPGTTGGAFSLLNLDYVRDIDVYSGGFSSHYGDRLSSVMNIKLREGNREEIDGQLDLSFVGISGQLEGPINDGRGSWMVSTRYGSIQFVARFVNEEEQPSWFYDINVKLVYNLSSKHQISFIDIYSYNDWLTPKDYSIANYWNWYGNFNAEQNIIGLSWKYLWSEKGFSNTTLSHIYNNNRTNFFTTATDEERIDYNSAGHIIQIRNTNFYNFSPEHRIEFGIESSLFTTDQDDFVASGFDLYGNYKPDLYIVTKLTGLKLGGFLSYEWTPFPQLKLTPGLRIDYFDYNKDLNLSPRFSASFLVNDKLSLSGSVGIYNQYLPSYFLVQNENFKNVHMPTTYHYVLGLNYLLSEDIKFSIEYYYKDYRDLLFDANLPGLYLLDEPINNLFYGDHTNLVNGSHGNSNGIEMMVQKKMSDNFYGLASLSLFSCKYLDLDGIERSRITDNRVLVAVEGGYKLNEEWEFSMRWSYAGGVPYTPYDEFKSTVLGNAVFDIDSINTQRLPHYQTLSIRVDKRFHFSNSNLILYLSIWNLFDRKNIASHGWSEYYNTSVNYNLISIIPVLGVEFEF